MSDVKVTPEIDAIVNLVRDITVSFGTVIYGALDSPRVDNALIDLVAAFSQDPVTRVKLDATTEPRPEIQPLYATTWALEGEVALADNNQTTQGGASIPALIYLIGPLWTGYSAPVVPTAFGTTMRAARRGETKYVQREVERTALEVRTVRAEVLRMLPRIAKIAQAQLDAFSKLTAQTYEQSEIAIANNDALNMANIAATADRRATRLAELSVAQSLGLQRLAEALNPALVKQTAETTETNQQDVAPPTNVPKRPSSSPALVRRSAKTKTSLVDFYGDLHVYIHRVLPLYLESLNSDNLDTTALALTTMPSIDASTVRDIGPLVNALLSQVDSEVKQLSRQSIFDNVIAVLVLLTASGGENETLVRMLRESALELLTAAADLIGNAPSRAQSRYEQLQQTTKQLTRNGHILHEFKDTLDRKVAISEKLASKSEVNCYKVAEVCASNVLPIILFIYKDLLDPTNKHGVPETIKVWFNALRNYGKITSRAQLGPLYTLINQYSAAVKGTRNADFSRDALTAVMRALSAATLIVKNASCYGKVKSDPATFPETIYQTTAKSIRTLDGRRISVENAPIVCPIPGKSELLRQKKNSPAVYAENVKNFGNSFADSVVENAVIIYGYAVQALEKMDQTLPTFDRVKANLNKTTADLTTAGIDIKVLREAEQRVAAAHTDAPIDTNESAE